MELEQAVAEEHVRDDLADSVGTAQIDVVDPVDSAVRHIIGVLKGRRTANGIYVPPTEHSKRVLLETFLGGDYSIPDTTPVEVARALAAHPDFKKADANYFPPDVRTALYGNRN